jgi:hypothetical protein
MARRIMVVAGLMIAAGAYYVFLQERDDFLYLLGAGLVTMTVAWVFQYQIDHLMMRGVPQRLDEPVREMLIHTSRQFPALDLSGRMMAEDRMVRWLAPREVITMSDPQPPEEAKHILAWYAVLLTLHQEQFLFKGLDRIVFYHHPFLTPGHPDDVHIFELETGDGTMIFSLPHLIKGHGEPGHYNIALHLMAEAYSVCYPPGKITWPETIWDDLEAISGYSKQALEAYTGMQMDDPWPVAVHHQVMFPQARIGQVGAVFPQLRNEQ